MKRLTSNIRRLLCVALLLLLAVPLAGVHVQRAAAATGVTTTLGPGGNTAGWTNGNNAWGTTDNNVYATAVTAKGATVTSDWNTYGFDSSLPTDMTITKVEIIPQYHVDTQAFTETLTVTPLVGGAACGAGVQDATKPLADTEFTADVTSCRTWTRANLLNANFATRIAAARANAGSAGNVNWSLDYIKVRVTYNTPTYTQISYRFYEPADSTTPGTPWAAQNTAITLYSPTDKFRLRYLLQLADVNLSASGETFKLQFGAKGAGCATATYADVTTSSTIAFYNNPTPANDTTITSSGNDPTDGARTVIFEKYAENSPFNTPNAVTTAQDGIWDISLIGNGATANTAYCFRVVKNTGTALDTYTVYPEITTAPAATLDVNVVDSTGANVASPSFAMSNLTTTFTCQTSTATVGSGSQRIRLRNTTTNAPWTLSIAATSGSTALWSAGTPKYDFNDASGSPAGCSAGLDSDVYAGQLSLDPSAGTVTARSVCTTTGVTKGSSSAFVEGTTNSITLLSASASANTGCYWEMTGISASQKVPSSAAAGSYSLNLTMTVVAN